MTRALVVGINSFVGRHLAQTLIARGVEVIGSARSISPNEALPIITRRCDLIDPANTSELVSDCRPDWVLNLAGATTARDPQPMYDLHVTGALNLLAAVREHAPSASVVLLGSAAEYGTPACELLPVQESCPANPTSFFGASKLAQTQAAIAAAANWNLRVTCLRPFNIIGPGLPGHYMPGAFASRLRDALASDARDPISLVNGAATRDFIDARDVADAIARCASQPSSPGTAQIYNVASGSEVPIADVARELCELAGGFELQDQGAADSRSNVSRSCGSADRLRRATGWQPCISWRQSLRDLWDALEPAAASSC